MIKRALCIGINDYPTSPLRGCVPDAKRMFRLLSQNGDSTTNFDCKLLTTESGNQVSLAAMKLAIENLFTTYADSAVLYFSGHGTKNVYGGYLISQDGTTSNPGFAFDDLLKLVRRSPVREITIIVDCCHSGAMGDTGESDTQMVKLREGVSILTASGADEFALENGKGGVFTSIVANALDGQAADILGAITVAGIYNQADSLLTAWEQRPMFKSHLSRMLPIRHVHGKTTVEKLRRINEYFPTVDYEHRLDPEYEPNKVEIPIAEATVNPVKEALFAELQALRALGLVEPLAPEEHMYFAAIHRGRCRLTPLGQFYWSMVNKRKI